MPHLRRLSPEFSVPMGAYPCAVDRLRAIHQLRQTVPELSALVGESSAMRKLLRYARQAAQSQGPILLRGEEEVGKAQLAEAIHFGSERAAGPLITLNCKALPSERMALELMGSDEARPASVQDVAFITMADDCTYVVTEYTERLGE